VKKHFPLLTISIIGLLSIIVFMILFTMKDDNLDDSERLFLTIPLYIATPIFLYVYRDILFKKKDNNSKHENGNNSNK
jgi:dipeptide/tripeptide permease